MRASRALRALAATAGLSLRQVADKAGLHHTTLSRPARQRSPTMIARVAEVLQVSPDIVARALAENDRG